MLTKRKSQRDQAKDYTTSVVSREIQDWMIDRAREQGWYQEMYRL
jgi:hypothetical protein